MENIGSITYRPDLIQLYLGSNEVTKFFRRFDPRKFQEFVRLTLLGITPIRGIEDVPLEGFLASHERLSHFREHYPDILSFVVYPKQGEIKEFRLNRRTEFFSDFHSNSDPLTIKQMSYGIHVDENKTKNYLWIDRNNPSTPNTITGGIFFKKNPFENPKRYKGFLEFSRLDPSKLVYPPR